MLDDDGTVYCGADDDDGVDAFALASINRAHYSSRNVFVVGVEGAAGAAVAVAAASYLSSASSSIYLHSDV